jgi:hypothetical protein
VAIAPMLRAEARATKFWSSVICESSDLLLRVKQSVRSTDTDLTIPIPNAYYVFTLAGASAVRPHHAELARPHLD